MSKFISLDFSIPSFENWWNYGNDHLLAFMTTMVCSVKWISDAETFHPQMGPFKIILWHFHSCKCKCLLIHEDLKHIKTSAALSYARRALPLANYLRLFVTHLLFHPTLGSKNSVKISILSEKRQNK